MDYCNSGHLISRIIRPIITSKNTSRSKNWIVDCNEYMPILIESKVYLIIL